MFQESIPEDQWGDLWIWGGPPRSWSRGRGRVLGEVFGHAEEMRDKKHCGSTNWHWSLQNGLSLECIKLNTEVLRIIKKHEIVRVYIYLRMTDWPLTYISNLVEGCPVGFENATKSIHVHCDNHCPWPQHNEPTRQSFSSKFPTLISIAKYLWFYCCLINMGPWDIISV